MSKKSNFDSEEKKLINEDDYEYEKMLADKERKRREALENAEKQRLKQERDEEKAREKRINDERVELMKLKNGVIDNSDTIKEEHEVIREVHGVEKVANIWYRNKMMIIFIVFLLIVAVYIAYTQLTKKKPDLTVMMIANNGLETRYDELQSFFEKYTDDIDGNGYVYVQVLIMPLNPNSNDIQMYTTYTSKFLAQLQTSESIIVITDSNTEDRFKEIMKTDLSKDFPGNKYIDELGFSLNMQIAADELKYENMPNDVHISLRQPIKTVGDSLEEMEENYKKSFKVFERIVNDLTKKAEETNDPGLKTEPIKYDESSSETESVSSVSN